MNSQMHTLGVALYMIHFFCMVTSTTPRHQMKCGREIMIPDERIVGGVEVEPYSWPWMVSINTEWSATEPNRGRGHTCGGVLINTEWVLTAAHCLDDPNKPNKFPEVPPSSWRVTAAMHNRNVNSTTAVRWQQRGVRRFYPHPQFRDLSSSAYNDIALIQLDKPLTINAYVRPICLPNRRITPPGWNRCYTAGWGTTAENSTYYSLTLRHTEIPIVNYFTCRNRFGGAYRAQQHLCGGDWYNGEKDSCKGDSGGPLACELDDGSWYVAGIVSWGVGCGRQQSPGIYTNVRSYEHWILSILLYFSPESTLASQRLRLKRHAAENSLLLKRLLKQE